MKRFITIIFVAIFFVLLIGMFAQDNLKPALVVIKVKFQTVKELAAFKEEVQKVAEKYNIVVDDINFKSIK